MNEFFLQNLRSVALEFIYMGLKIRSTKSELYNMINRERSLSLNVRENVKLCNFLDIIEQVLIFSKKL